MENKILASECEALKQNLSVFQEINMKTVPQNTRHIISSIFNNRKKY